ncbi:phospholipase/Carboxylesterase superfamily protein [Colletotrichum orchidophilum]|uniref:Phospholipase/Carboxylesterase superfamily protein n=1 Tax=Colletotrichum orchidophilum TaxID=1209926 RepID=A0A1G4B658_9PEZI|nr:phospholipase/Carboxylesterase superfamily protein [Colletotrichum orchidophilum]OHE96765.1 phospholipase/Carboxylesterase superfamily protein [Colletotrichum orchidophilum]
MPPRIPTQEDFEQVQKVLPLALAFPNPPESTTAILLLFHGLGDSEAPFASFARAMSLPGVLSISVRGPSPLPPSMLPDDGPSSTSSSAGAGAGHFHWGDDITFVPSTDSLAPDPGFSKSSTLVVDRLIHETLVARCGWELSDIILFGFGQGGSLALGIASQLRLGQKVVDVTDVPSPAASASKPKRSDGHFDENTLKGVLSIGGPLPHSMVPTVSTRGKCKTKACLVQLDNDAFDAVKEEFLDVRLVKWKRKDAAMPRDREEMFPLMKFLAECLKSGW